MTPSEGIKDDWQDFVVTPSEGIRVMTNKILPEAPDGKPEGGTSEISS